MVPQSDPVWVAGSKWCIKSTSWRNHRCRWGKFQWQHCLMPNFFPPAFTLSWLSTCAKLSKVKYDLLERSRHSQADSDWRRETGHSLLSHFQSGGTVDWAPSPWGKNDVPAGPTHMSIMCVGYMTHMKCESQGSWQWEKRSATGRFRGWPAKWTEGSEVPTNPIPYYILMDSLKYEFAFSLTKYKQKVFDNRTQKCE